MRADRGQDRVSGRALAWIPVVLLVMSVEPRVMPAQELSGGSVASGLGTEETGDAATSSRGPDLVRVPPSGHLARFSPGASSADHEAGSAGSRGWWLGSSGIALVLAICGAICVAARKYRPQDSAGLVQVIGRVSLTPRHSIFVVRAGQRSLLIGTGAQGAPTLLGELTEPDQADTQTDPARVRVSRPGTRSDGPLEPRSPSTIPVLDIRLEEEE